MSISPSYPQKQFSLFKWTFWNFWIDIALQNCGGLKLGTLHPLPKCQSPTVNQDLVGFLCDLLVWHTVHSLVVWLLKSVKRCQKRENVFCQQLISKFETSDGAGWGVGLLHPLPRCQQSIKTFLARCEALLEDCQKLPCWRLANVKSCQNVKTFASKNSIQGLKL